MWKADKTLLDMTPHKEDVWNNVKKQYCDLLIPMMAMIEEPVLYYGGVKMGRVLERRLNKKFSAGATVSKTVCIFDMIESQINPGKFLDDLAEYVDNNTRIFITHPHRPMNFWSYNHWNEFDPDRFAYLIDYCGYEIVQHKSKVIKRKFKIGYRPLLRWLFGKYHFHAYEICLKK